MFDQTYINSVGVKYLLFATVIDTVLWSRWWWRTIYRPVAKADSTKCNPAIFIVFVGACSSRETLREI